MPIEIHAATTDRWDDVVTVFCRRGENPSWCWCRLFLTSPDVEVSVQETDNREALRQEIVAASTPPGLLAYVDGHPVGWTRVGPRSDFPRLRANKALRRVLSDESGVWWVTCFAVDSNVRRSGVGAALLNGAIKFARDHGAVALEGHPVDVAGLRTAKVSGSAIFTGTLAMFSSAGFIEVARTFPTRPVMRLKL